MDSRFLLLGALALLYSLVISCHYPIWHRALLINIIKIWLTQFPPPATLALLYFLQLVITLASLLIVALNFCSHLLNSPLLIFYRFSVFSHHFFLSAHHGSQRSADLLGSSLFLLLNLGALALYFYFCLSALLIIKGLLSLFLLLGALTLLYFSSSLCSAHHCTQFLLSSVILTVSAPWCTSLLYFSLFHQVSAPGVYILPKNWFFYKSLFGDMIFFINNAGQFFIKRGSFFFIKSAHFHEIHHFLKVKDWF